MPKNRIIHKKRYRSPKKGTKVRALINLLLSKKGATSLDAKEIGISTSNFHNALNDQIPDMYGFNISVIDEIPASKASFGNVIKVYRIVGRYKWDGKYRSFVNSKN